MKAMQVDWREIIFDLKRLPMKNSEISDALGGYISEPQIRAYADEVSSPGHFRGELLIALWIQKTTKSRDDAPMRPASLRSMPAARAVRA